MRGAEWQMPGGPLICFRFSARMRGRQGTLINAFSVMDRSMIATIGTLQSDRIGAGYGLSGLRH